MNAVVVPGWPALTWNPGQQVHICCLTVTPDMARQKLLAANFERQRVLRARNVERLAEEMRQKRYIPWMQAYVACLPDGRELLLNLNHSFQAIVQSGNSQYVVMTYVRVKDIEEAGRIYAVFDTHSARTWADSLRSVGADADRFSQKLVAAVRLVENHMGMNSYTVLEGRLPALERMNNYAQAAELFRAAVANGQNATIARLLTRVPVMAVALLTFRYQPSAAVEFWSMVSSGEGFQRGLPEMTFREWLTDKRRVFDGIHARKEMINAAALAWNASFNSNRLEILRPNAVRHLTIAGTSWHDGDPDRTEEAEAAMREAQREAIIEGNRKYRRTWTVEDEAVLLTESRKFTDINVIARYMDRSPGALRQKALQMGISLGITASKRTDRAQYD